MELEFKYRGRVIPGSQEGRKLHMPTANLEIEEGDISNLQQGVYASIVRIDKKLYKAITHYGPRAVFSETNPLFEVHIFGFDKDIYGEKIEVALMDFIRETQRFESVDAMMEQIEIDKKKAHQLLETFQI